MSKKITRILRNVESVRQLGLYLMKHFAEKQFAVRITIERYVAGRTDNQNALMHVWFADIAEHIGDDPKSVKADLKAMFLPEVEGLHQIMRPKDTHELSKTEMIDFMTAIEVFAANNNWELTRP